MLVLGSFAGCVAWVLPDAQFNGEARAGGVGEAQGEALRLGDAGPLSAYAKRDPGARVCFVREYGSLRHPPLWNYWRTYGLPNPQVPDAHWAVAVLSASRQPDFAVVRTQKLILAETPSCSAAGRLRLILESRSGRLPALSAFAEP